MADLLETYAPMEVMLEVAMPMLGDRENDLDPAIAETVTAAVCHEDMRPITTADLAASMATFVASVDTGLDWEVAGFLRQANDRYRGIALPPYPGTQEPTDLEFDLTELATLWVAPEHRGKRIGEELVRAATHLARRSGLTPFAVCNQSGRKTFENVGYTPVRETQDRVLEMFPPDFGESTGMLKLWYSCLAEYAGGMLIRYPRFAEFRAAA